MSLSGLKIETTGARFLRARTSVLKIRGFENTGARLFCGVAGCMTHCRDDIGDGRAKASRLAAPHELTVGWMSVVRLGEDAFALPMPHYS